MASNWFFPTVPTDSSGFAVYPPEYEVLAQSDQPRFTPFSAELSARQVISPPGQSPQVFSKLKNALAIEPLKRYTELVLHLLESKPDLWASFRNLRNNLEDHSTLRPYYLHVLTHPPEELWVLVRQIRDSNFWNDDDFRNGVIQHLRRQQCYPRERTTERHDVSPKYPQRGASVAKHQTDSSQGSHNRVSFRPRTTNSISPERMLRDTTTTHYASKKDFGSKQAPVGQCYTCPSPGCDHKPFLKIKHHENHMRKRHPDFLRSHPSYRPVAEPETESLARRRSNKMSNSEPRKIYAHTAKQRSSQEKNQLLIPPYRHIRRASNTSDLSGFSQRSISTTLSTPNEVEAVESTFTNDWPDPEIDSYSNLNSSFHPQELLTPDRNNHSDSLIGWSFGNDFQLLRDNRVNDGDITSDPFRRRGHDVDGL